MFYSNFANPSSILFFSVSYDSITGPASFDANFFIFGGISDGLFAKAPYMRDGLVSVDTYIVSTSLVGELGRVLCVVLDTTGFF